VHALAFDVTDAAAGAAGVEAALMLLDGLDVLVNNVGMQHREPLLDLHEEVWRTPAACRSYSVCEKAHGPRRGPFHTANERKIRESADATRHVERA
jgi:NAD(P)-dependent dehydrogenase (short-subunit alcohol dehydrogenase family)